MKSAAFSRLTLNFSPAAMNLGDVRSMFFERLLTIPNYVVMLKKTEQIMQLDQTEFHPYFQRYLSLVPEGPIAEILEQQIEQTKQFLKGISEEQALYRYAESKWSIKEIILHIIDAERIFTNRALRFSRNDGTELPGFAENDYVPQSLANSRSMASLINEYETVRRSSVSLFGNMTDEQMRRTGRANNTIYSVRAVAGIMLGHELHHLQIIRERYLK